ncbi:hypothetical protein RRG08_063675 [Elysia crispata]|uniref:EGF-like domain-containing protein n=1 Tax=Elysia crispata TaxID=231223 RepID=A0AAE0ZA16_9GAST|nr:hypothetical protein RRG08_063675 [Elysia crispata]
MHMLKFILFWKVSEHLCRAGQVTVGLRYRNYTNYNGGLATGVCCDHPNLSIPNCPPDQCDTSFFPCATYVGGHPCSDFIFNPTPVMNDKNSFVLGSVIGNQPGNTGVSSVVSSGTYSPGNISIYIVAEEEPNFHLIANFSFVIDWAVNSFNITPLWRQLVLTDTQAELGIDVYYQCAYHYFGPTCNIYCKPTHQCTCRSDGSRECTFDWSTPFNCSSTQCLNGGFCVNINTTDTCLCPYPYTGNVCENITVTTASTAATATTATTATTAKTATPATTVTTATAATSFKGTMITRSGFPSIHGRSSTPRKPSSSLQPKLQTPSSQDAVHIRVTIYVPVVVGVIVIVTAISIFLWKKHKKSRVGNTDGKSQAFDKAEQGTQQSNSG